MPQNQSHPAALWAKNAALTVSDKDCITTVMLKILDRKCKMNQQQRDALFAIYDVTRTLPGDVFNESVHICIETARSFETENSRRQIHLLRVDAEAAIPKTVMKAFKAMLGQALEAL